MILGDSKAAVVENIKKASMEERFNDKVEIGDPELSDEQKTKLLKKYLRTRVSIQYKLCNIIARTIVSIVARRENRKTEIKGIKNIMQVTSGAIITSNHFNPVDNTVIRTMVHKAGFKRLYIVSQENNLAMKGIVGFLMNFTDIIPISSDNVYMRKIFPALLEEKLLKRQYILIYPEQEMWINYRKPRPPKRGAYYYAAKFNVPIISCFIEIRDREEKETLEFHKTKYVLHILKPIYPDPALSVRDNSVIMMETDYAQKKEAYEKAYGKKLDYSFEYSDIAGWMGNCN